MEVEMRLRLRPMVLLAAPVIALFCALLPHARSRSEADPLRGEKPNSEQIDFPGAAHEKAVAIITAHDGTVRRAGGLPGGFVVEASISFETGHRREAVVRTFAHLGALKHLRRLEIKGSAIKDEEMQQVGRLSNLQSLQIWGTSITDEGMKYLQELTNLRDLQLFCGIKFTAEGLKHLAGMKKLDTLSLKHSPVRDAGMKHLAPLRSLRHLDLEGTYVSAPGMRHLSQLTNLETVGLVFTSAGDQGLAHLKSLPRLRKVWIHDSSVTPNGAKAFAKDRPAVKLIP